MQWSLLFCFQFPEDSGAADLWLLNSCTVKNPSEDNFRNAVKKAQELDKHLVVAGCVPQGQPRHQIIKGISVIGVTIIILAPVVQTMDSAIRRINHYRPLDNSIGFACVYSVDSDLSGG